MLIWDAWSGISKRVPIFRETTLNPCHPLSDVSTLLESRRRIATTITKGITVWVCTYIQSGIRRGCCGEVEIRCFVNEQASTYLDLCKTILIGQIRLSSLNPSRLRYDLSNIVLSVYLIDDENNPLSLSLYDFLYWNSIKNLAVKSVPIGNLNNLTMNIRPFSKICTILLLDTIGSIVIQSTKGIDIQF